MRTLVMRSEGLAIERFSAEQLLCGLNTAGVPNVTKEDLAI
jgi:hypothetical protein